MMTRIGRYQVPVRGRWATIVAFRSGEHGRKEAGLYQFWTVVLKAQPADLVWLALHDRPLPRRLKKARMFARSEVGLEVGERWRRFAREDEFTWKVQLCRGANVAYLRPSTLPELRHWMLEHKRDSPYAQPHAMIGGRLVQWRATRWQACLDLVRRRWDHFLQKVKIPTWQRSK